MKCPKAGGNLNCIRNTLKTTVCLEFKKKVLCEEVTEFTVSFFTYMT